MHSVERFGDAGRPAGVQRTRRSPSSRGFGRSGSTLLERLLGEAPSVTCLGEVVHLWQRGLIDDELCACGEPFSRCPLWQEIGKAAFGGWSRVDAQRILELHDQVDRQRHLIRTAAAGGARERAQSRCGSTPATTPRFTGPPPTVTGATVVVDSSKHASLAFALTHDPEIDLRVLHMVRDSRGRGVQLVAARDAARVPRRRRDAPLLPA